MFPRLGRSLNRPCSPHCKSTIDQGRWPGKAAGYSSVNCSIHLSLISKSQYRFFTGYTGLPL